MKVVKVFDKVEIPNPHFISVRALHTSEQVQFEHLVLEGGEEQKRHIAYTNVYLYVLEGQGVLEGGDDVIQLQVDMLVEMPPETPHRLVNPGKGRLRILNIKAPRATKSTHIVAEKEV
ncbi:MAG: cupin domain-containing protein [Anaerolineales bacterium]|nr:cupin domain-containing protein [Anaerolineales bacterium]